MFGLSENPVLPGGYQAKGRGSPVFVGRAREKGFNDLRPEVYFLRERLKNIILCAGEGMTARAQRIDQLFVSINP